MKKGVLLVLVACGGAAHPAATDHRFDAVDALVQARVAAGVPGAVVWIQQHGKVIHQAAFGSRVRGANEPMTADTIFDLESVTKIFTAATAEALVADGKLSIDAPVARYLPEFATAGKDKVTVRDLFVHSSGLPLDMDLSAAPDTNAAWKLMLDVPPEGPPHTKVSYSDVGYRIAGKVIEAAAGEPLDRVLAERVTAKLGLHDTSYDPHAQLARVADAGGTRGVVIDETDAKLGGIVGCDGLFASAHDVAALAQAVLDGSVAGAKDMSTDQTPWADPKSDDTDWITSAFTGPKTVGWEIPTPHSYGPGYAYCKAGISGTFVCVDPTSDLVAVYLTNFGMPNGNDYAGWYGALAPDQVFAAIKRALS